MIYSQAKCFLSKEMILSENSSLLYLPLALLLFDDDDDDDVTIGFFSSSSFPNDSDEA